MVVFNELIDDLGEVLIGTKVSIKKLPLLVEVINLELLNDKKKKVFMEEL